LGQQPHDWAKKRTSFIAKSQIAQGGFSILSSGSLGYMQCTTNFDELRG
jgi:hypothetical protein